MEDGLKEINLNLIKLRREIELLRKSIAKEHHEETELTDWAKEELEEARKTPEAEYISLEEVKKNMRSKK